jgi:hypothetical protein
MNFVLFPLRKLEDRNTNEPDAPDLAYVLPQDCEKDTILVG